MDAHTDPEERAPGKQRGLRHPAPDTFRNASSDVANLPVHAVMTTRVLVTTPDDDILLAWELMIHASIRHLPVVDGTRLVGMIDDRRLIGECALSPLSAKPRTVRELVDHPPLQVHLDTPLREAAARMAAQRADAVCVTTPAGGLIGIVTTGDLIRALAGRAPSPREEIAATVTPLLFRLTPVLPAAH
jgi:acetoin utilization protein AcuB